MAVALLVALGVAVAAPETAGAGQKAFESLKVKRGGPSIKRSQMKRAPQKSRLTRMKNFFGRKLSRFKKASRMQHGLLPAKSGDVRVFELQTAAGGTTTKGLLTQRVGEVRMENGILRAQVAQTWEGSGRSSTTHHVQEVGKQGVLMATAEKLNEAPKVQTHTTGVGLPKKLRVGQTWSNSTSWQHEGGSTESHTTGRVLGKVRRQGPDRKMHDGFEIETVTHSTTTVNGQKHTSTHVQRSVYLKGIGEIESKSQVNGQDGTVTRRLIGFTPGGE